MENICTSPEYRAVTEAAARCADGPSAAARRLYAAYGVLVRGCDAPAASLLRELRDATVLLLNMEQVPWADGLRLLHAIHGATAPPTGEAAVYVEVRFDKHDILLCRGSRKPIKTRLLWTAVLADLLATRSDWAAARRLAHAGVMILVKTREKCPSKCWNRHLNMLFGTLRTAAIFEVGVGDLVAVDRILENLSTAWYDVVAGGGPGACRRIDVALAILAGARGYSRAVKMACLLYAAVIPNWRFRARLVMRGCIPPLDVLRSALSHQPHNVPLTTDLQFERFWTMFSAVFKRKAVLSPLVRLHPGESDKDAMCRAADTVGQYDDPQLARIHLADFIGAENYFNHNLPNALAKFMFPRLTQSPHVKTLLPTLTNDKLLKRNTYEIVMMQLLLVHPMAITSDPEQVELPHVESGARLLEQVYGQYMCLEDVDSVWEHVRRPVALEPTPIDMMYYPRIVEDAKLFSNLLLAEMGVGLFPPADGAAQAQLNACGVPVVPLPVGQAAWTMAPQIIAHSNPSISLKTSIEITMHCLKMKIDSKALTMDTLQTMIIDLLATGSDWGEARRLMHYGAMMITTALPTDKKQEKYLKRHRFMFFYLLRTVVLCEVGVAHIPLANELLVAIDRAAREVDNGYLREATAALDRVLQLLAGMPEQRSRGIKLASMLYGFVESTQKERPVMHGYVNPPERDLYIAAMTQYDPAIANAKKGKDAMRMLMTKVHDRADSQFIMKPAQDIVDILQTDAYPTVSNAMHSVVEQGRPEHTIVNATAAFGMTAATNTTAMKYAHTGVLEPMLTTRLNRQFPGVAALPRGLQQTYSVVLGFAMIAYYRATSAAAAGAPPPLQYADLPDIESGKDLHKYIITTYQALIEAQKNWIVARRPVAIAPTPFDREHFPGIVHDARVYAAHMAEVLGVDVLAAFDDTAPLVPQSCSPAAHVLDAGPMPKETKNVLDDMGIYISTGEKEEHIPRRMLPPSSSMSQPPPPLMSQPPPPPSMSQPPPPLMSQPPPPPPPPSMSRPPSLSPSMSPSMTWPPSLSPSLASPTTWTLPPASSPSSLVITREPSPPSTPVWPEDTPWEDAARQEQRGYVSSRTTDPHAGSLDGETYRGIPATTTTTYSTFNTYGNLTPSPPQDWDIWSVPIPGLDPDEDFYDASYMSPPYDPK